MSLPIRRCAVGAVTSTALLLASASPALAAAPHHKPPIKAAASARFTVHGIVLNVSGSKVKVLSSVAKIGKKAAHNQVVTLTLTARTKRTTKAHTHPSGHRPAEMLAASSAGVPAAAPALQAGDDITAAGTVASNGTLLTAQETSTVLPAEALVGQVAAVAADGLSFTVTTHDQVDGDHAEHDNATSVLVALGAAPVTGPAVTAGQYVVVLGEAEDRDMLAAKVYTFSTAPALVAGEVTAADTTSKALTVTPVGHEQDGQDHEGANPATGAGVTVDASAADVIVNGATPATAAFPAVGDEVLSVGTAGVTPDSMTATLVFDFNPADDGSLQNNQDNEDHGDNGDNGDNGDDGEQDSPSQN